MAGVILHTVGLQGGQAAVDAFQQTTAIDTVSGATFTSAAMLNAVTEGLQQSMAGETA